MDPFRVRVRRWLRDEEMARIDHGQPPWSWLLRLGAVALVCLALVSPAPLLAVEGKALFQDRVDYTLTDQSGTDFSGQALAFSSFGRGHRRRCQLRRRRPARFDPHPGQFFAGRFPVGPISAMP